MTPVGPWKRQVGGGEAGLHFFTLDSGEGPWKKPFLLEAGLRCVLRTWRPRTARRFAFQEVQHVTRILRVRSRRSPVAHVVHSYRLRCACCSHSSMFPLCRRAPSLLPLKAQLLVLVFSRRLIDSRFPHLSTELLGRRVQLRGRKKLLSSDKI